MTKYIHFTGEVIERFIDVDYIEFTLERQHCYGYGYHAIQKCIAPRRLAVKAFTALGNYIRVEGHTEIRDSIECLRSVSISPQDRPKNSDDFILTGSL